MSDNNSRYVLKNVNVMVIDDNKHMVTLVVEILYALGITNIIKVSDAAKAFTEL